MFWLLLVWLGCSLLMLGLCIGCIKQTEEKLVKDDAMFNAMGYVPRHILRFVVLVAVILAPFLLLEVARRIIKEDGSYFSSLFFRWCHLIRWTFSPWRWKEDHRAVNYYDEDDDELGLACTCGRVFWVSSDFSEKST